MSDFRPSENQAKLRHIVEAMINKIMLRFGRSCAVYDIFNLILIFRYSCSTSVCSSVDQIHPWFSKVPLL